MTAPQPEAAEHLARLYAFAQLVTPDPSAATRLVRATYRRAFAEATPLPEGEAGRLYLYRLLLDVRREERGEVPTTLLGQPLRHDAPDDLAVSRERHAQRLIDLHLPPALVSLATADRLLLLLCDVEGLSCNEAAGVLGMPVEEACAQYETALSTLRARVLASVSIHEQAMLEEVLTDERMRLGITAALQDELAPVPPTLRPQITPPQPPPPAPEPVPPPPAGSWIRAGYVLLLLFTLAVAAYLLLQRTPVAGETNLIVLAARHAAEAQTTLSTHEALEAEAFVRDHTGWRLALPTIRGYTLQGAGLDEIVPGIMLPVFRYTADSAAVTLYTLTYSLLDQTEGKLSLEPDVLEQLEDDAHFELHDIEGTQVLLWRSRDDLFLAVPDVPDPALARRITP